MTVGAKTFAELRALYARSRFVVVPLLPSDSDNGITTILEAFAMGKAVICTETAGQIGVLEHGVNCLRVPAFDVEALRAAIVELWRDPQMCQRLRRRRTPTHRGPAQQRAMDSWGDPRNRRGHSRSRRRWSSSADCESTGTIGWAIRLSI